MKISIITATYNSEKTIANTIESVLSQTHKDIEYIIVDGMSDDSTIEIIKQYEPRFCGKLKWITEKDNGIYDAMNKGIGMATGEIVGILNSDDHFASNDILDKINKDIKDYDAVYGDVSFINGDNPDVCVRYYSSKIFRPFMLRFGIMPAHPSFYARKDVYDKYGTYSLEYKIASDYEMMVRLFHKHNIRAKYLPLTFVTMRLGGVSTKNVANRWLITKEDVKACKQNGLYTNILFICVKYLLKIFEFRRQSIDQANKKQMC